MEWHWAWHPAPSEAWAGISGRGWGLMQGIFAGGMPTGWRGAGRWALPSPVRARSQMMLGRAFGDRAVCGEQWDLHTSPHMAL